MVIPRSPWIYRGKPPDPDTTVTCTDVPANGNVCSFALQTVVCRNIIGNFSNHIGINTHILNNNTVYIASIGSLAIALIVSITVLLTVIVIILTRNKAKTIKLLSIYKQQTEQEEAHKWRQHMKILYL